MPRLVLTLPRSRSREYARARELALAYPRTTAGGDSILLLEADTTDMTQLATIEAVLEIGHRWKGTGVEVDGKPLPPKEARNMLRCVREKLAAPAETQRWHCHSERYAPDLSLPMIYSAPCRFARRFNMLFWSDYVDLVDGVERTDHARLERAYEGVSATSECRWCPGFSTQEMTAFIRRLPHDYSAWRSPDSGFIDLQEPVERILRRIAALDPSLLDALQTTLDGLQREPPLTREETPSPTSGSPSSRTSRASPRLPTFATRPRGPKPNAKSSAPGSQRRSLLSTHVLASRPTRRQRCAGYLYAQNVNVVSRFTSAPPQTRVFVWA